MDYSKPIDAALFPKGVTRCPLSNFLAWMTIPIWHIMFGTAAALVIFVGGLGYTALDDRFAFGLWITLDLTIVTFGAGAFVTGFLYYILNIKELKSVLNFAVLNGFLCFICVLIVLLLDIGQPLRFWFGFWYPNVDSMMAELIFCIAAYSIVIILEFVTLILDADFFQRNKLVKHLTHNLHVYMPIFAGMCAFIATFYQGSLGGMYGALFGRPYLFREGFFVWPSTFFLYTLSAIGIGPMVLIILATIIEKFTGKKLVAWKVKQLLAKIGISVLAVYTLFKCIDTYYWIENLLPRAGNSLEDMFYGFIYSQVWFWAEHIVLFVAIFILAIPLFRNIPFLFYSAILLTCYSVVLNRYVMVIQALGIPVMPFENWTYYWPNWTEWGAFAFIAGIYALAFSVIYRYCTVFPDEIELNKK